MTNLPSSFHYLGCRYRHVFSPCAGCGLCVFAVVLDRKTGLWAGKTNNFAPFLPMLRTISSINGSTIITPFANLYTPALKSKLISTKDGVLHHSSGKPSKDCVTKLMQKTLLHLKQNVKHFYLANIFISLYS